MYTVNKINIANTLSLLKERSKERCKCITSAIDEKDTHYNKFKEKYVLSVYNIYILHTMFH